MAAIGSEWCVWRQELDSASRLYTCLSDRGKSGLKPLGIEDIKQSRETLRCPSLPFGSPWTSVNFKCVSISQACCFLPFSNYVDLHFRSRSCCYWSIIGMLSGCVSGEEKGNSLHRFCVGLHGTWHRGAARCTASSAWGLWAGADARLWYILHPTKEWVLHTGFRGTSLLLQSILHAGSLKQRT